MIIYSIVTMRDLIRNYKMVIKNKTNDEESDYDPLVSPASSYQGYGSYYSNESFESDEDYFRSSVTPGFQKQINCNTLRPSKYNTRSDLLQKRYDEELQQCSKTTVEDACLLGLSKDINESFAESVHQFSDKLPIDKETHTHHSVITIFAVWNTTMGSSLLAMAWGFERTGLFSGIVINILIAALCLYTAYILLSINQKHGIPGNNTEVPHLCKLLLGRWAEMLAKLFSLIVLTGANIVYWVLMSNFLYNSVIFIHDIFKATASEQNPDTLSCRRETMNLNETSFLPQSSTQLFYRYWDLYSTVPVVLAVIMFPLLNFKSPTFFTKFNSLGTISVLYLLSFITVKAINWGVNIQDWTSEIQLKSTFCALTGMLSLSYFIHNIIISIMRHNRHQEHNGRDLMIAFCLITFTYIFIGSVFYISFPLAKSCIEDNIFNNFSKQDVMTIVARILFLFQLFTVFPLISFMLRNDVFTNLNIIFKKSGFGQFSYGKVIAVNCVVVFICVIFACYLPRIGTLIRYTGALSGLVYIFLLPSLLKMASLRKEGHLTVAKKILYSLIILAGVLNLFLQFFITDK